MGLEKEVWVQEKEVGVQGKVVGVDLGMVEEVYLLDIGTSPRSDDHCMTGSCCGHKDRIAMNIATGYLADIAGMQLEKVLR